MKEEKLRTEGRRHGGTAVRRYGRLPGENCSSSRLVAVAVPRAGSGAGGYVRSLPGSVGGGLRTAVSNM